MCRATAWTNFAKTGDPNGADIGGARPLGPRWPRYDDEADNVLRLDVESGGGIVVQTALRKTACDFQSTHQADATLVRQLTDKE